MSIGVCKAVSSLLTKLCDKSTYDWTGSQVQHVLATSVVVGVVLAMGAPSATAGTLGINGGRKKDFYDWEYAQKVWFEMNTWEAEEAEWAKYSADFDPWLEVWKKNRAQAKKLLATYPEQKRHNIQRAFDIQLVWDAWFDEYYGPWFRHYQETVDYETYRDLPELKSFEERRASYNARRKELERLHCVPQKFISECGVLPDWRSPEWKVEEKKLEVRRAELLGSPTAKAEMKKLKALQDALEAQ